MENKDSTQPKPITDFGTLVKERSRTVMMEVDYRDERIAFEIEIISNYEWMALEHAVPYPERVKAGMSADGVKYDYNHPDYQIGLAQRRTTIQLKRIARCIQATIEGDTNDEQARYLDEHFEIGFLSAIAVRLNELHNEGEATVLARSATFHRNGHTATTSNGTPAL